MQLALTVNCFQDEDLLMAQQLGAQHIVAEAGGDILGGWDVARLRAMRNRVEKAGLELVGIDALPPALYERAILGQPGRDEQITGVCLAIAHAGEAGIGLVGYGWTPAGLRRTTESVVGRGGARVAAYDHALASPAPETGQVAAEALWANLGYFLERVIPAAERAGVRLACRPDDPPVSRQGGVARILHDVEGLSRLFELAPSACHGLDFWQGTVAAMPGVDLLAAIRRFGAAKRIFLVSVGNLQGTADSFQEGFLDEIPDTILRALQTYRAVSYAGPLRAVSPPAVEGDTPWGHKGRAHDLGYLRALLQVISEHPPSGSEPEGGLPADPKV